MTLEDFLSDFDQHLKEYGEKIDAAKEEEVQRRQMDFFQYMMAYMTEGSPANAAVKQATKAILTDEIFVNRLADCLEYVIAMTLAAALSNQEEEDDK